MRYASVSICLAAIFLASAVMGAPYAVGPNPSEPNWTSWGYQVDYQNRANWLAVSIPWGSEAAMSGNYTIEEDFLFRVDPSTSGLANPSTIYGQPFWNHDGIYGLGEFFDAGLGARDRNYTLELSLGAVDTWKVFYDADRDAILDAPPEHYIFEGMVSTYWNRNGYFYGILVEGDGKYNGDFSPSHTEGTPNIIDSVFHAGKGDPGRVICVSTTGNDATGDGTLGNPYATIQKAVDESGAGDTIYVAAGTYTGTINIDGKTDIAIVGETRDSVIIKPSSTLPWNVGGYGSSRSTPVRIVSSRDIDISNVTLDLDTVKANYVFGILFWNSTGVINNNVVKNISLPDVPGGYYEFGSYIRAPSFSDDARAAVTFSNNQFIDCGRVAILIHDFVDMNVIGNTFTKTFDDFGYAVEMGSRSTGIISGNTVTGYDTPAASDGSASAALYIENCFTGGVPQVNKPVVISGNTLTGNQFGIWIGNEYDGFSGDVDIRVILLNNTITGNTDAGVFVADEDRSAGSSVLLNGFGNVIQGNGDVGYWIYTYNDGSITALLSSETISGHGIGIEVANYVSGGTGSFYDLSARFCKIVGNTTWGINNGVADPFDAAYNWWGDAGGPGSGGANGVNGNVDWNPPLASAPSAGKLAIKAGTSSVIYRKFGQSVGLELWQEDLPSAAAGYQAFLSFDKGLLSFTSGAYTASPYGLPVVSPISASGTNIDLAAIVNPPQTPSQANAKLADLTFTIGNSEGVTEVAFRATDPLGKFTDNTGDEIPTVTVNGPKIVIDNTAPVIICPSDITVSCDAGVCYATITNLGTPTVTDNLSGVASVTNDHPSSQFPKGTTVVTWIATDNAGNFSTCTQTVTVNDTEKPQVTKGTIASCYATQAAAEAAAIAATTATDNCTAAGSLVKTASTVGDCSAVITVRVTDEAGNYDEVTYNTRIDGTPPVITVPAPITVYCDPGHNYATVSFTVTANDNCDGALPVTCNPASGSQFPIGTTTVNCTATDSCGNVGTNSFTVTVLDKNQATITIELQGVVAGPITRNIELVFGGSLATGVQCTVNTPVTFTNGIGTVTVEIQPAAVWTCVTAKDKQHTLRSQTALTAGASQYTASFTGGDKLLAGDLTNDNLVDILDFGVFVGQYGSNYHGPYTFPARDADITGDGQVGSADFSSIQINFLRFGEVACLKAAAASATQTPRTSVSVIEMARVIGAANARLADVNNDKVVDLTDMKLFAQRMLGGRR